ncbi:hypothetical protein [Clostridium baratii]
MSYFKDTNAFILGNGNLRHPQRMAYQAILEEFEKIKRNIKL